jgi:hypothetical protein
MAAALTVRTESHPVECGAHVYRYGGRRPLDRSSIHPDCARPFRLACSVPGCPAYLVISCDASDDRKCAPCAKRYRGRVQHIAESVLDLLADGDGLFITTTPPGDRQHGPKGNPCPCTPAGGVELDRWNAQQGRRVNSFRTQLRRLLARQGVEVDYFRCVETQDGHRRADGVGRMGLQDHWVLSVRAGRLVMTKSLERKIKALAVRCGYGHHCKVDPIRGRGAARKVARYVSKYVAKAVSSRDEVPWRRPFGLVEVEDPAVDYETGVLDVRHDIRPTGPRTYRTWTKSRAWGSDMVTVRAVQRGWATGLLTTARAEGVREDVFLLLYERGRQYGWAAEANAP